MGGPFTTLDPEDYDFAEDQDYVFIGYLHTRHTAISLSDALPRDAQR